MGNVTSKVLSSIRKQSGYLTPPILQFQIFSNFNISPHRNINSTLHTSVSLFLYAYFIMCWCLYTTHPRSKNLPFTLQLGRGLLWTFQRNYFSRTRGCGMQWNSILGIFCVERGHCGLEAFYFFRFDPRGFPCGLWAFQGATCLLRTYSALLLA